jgi:hypothetical protein
MQNGAMNERHLGNSLTLKQFCSTMPVAGSANLISRLEME